MKINYWFATKAGILVAIVGSILKLSGISAILASALGLPTPTPWLILSVVPLFVEGFIAGLLLAWWR